MSYTIKDYAHVLQALGEGKTIEHVGEGEHPRTCDSSSLLRGISQGDTYPPHEYRVKAEPQAAYIAVVKTHRGPWTLSQKRSHADAVTQAEQAGFTRGLHLGVIALEYDPHTGKPTSVRLV